MSVLYGHLLAQEIYQQIRQKVLSSSNRPTLATILIGDNAASKIYVRAKEKACSECGFIAKTFLLKEEVSEKEVISLIEKLNKDRNIDGILLQLPLPKHLRADNIISHIDSTKDVDGLTPTNIYKLYSGEDGLFPCTPLGVIHLLEKNKITIAGKEVLIVGRSKLVGLPLFLLLNRLNATITLAHSYTENLKELTLSSDIIVTAIGKAHYFDASYFNKDACIIDVGISKEGGKIKGDVDWQALKDKVAYVSATPKGSGPLTVAMLMKNTYKAFKENKRD